MNRDRMLRVADEIEAHPEHFDMSSWVTATSDTPTSELRILTGGDLDLRADCGTTACVAGWAVYLWPDEIDTRLHVGQNAAAILGLSNVEADDLFYAAGDAATMAAALRDLVAEDES